MGRGEIDPGGVPRRALWRWPEPCGSSHADFACTENDDLPECEGKTEESCSNETDDDGDGQVDCADGDCSWARGCGGDGQTEASNEDCSNGIDDDDDGFMDCDDFSCIYTTSVTVCG